MFMDNKDNVGSGYTSTLSVFSIRYCLQYLNIFLLFSVCEKREKFYHFAIVIASL